jgi:hypothetical protein
MTTTQNGNEGIMVSEIGIIKCAGTAAGIALGAILATPIITGVINESTGVSLGVVGAVFAAVFSLSMAAIGWSLWNNYERKLREAEINSSIKKQAETISQLHVTTNDLIDGQRDLKMLMLKIGQHAGVPACAENLANMKAIDHVRKAPGTI